MIDAEKEYGEVFRAEFQDIQKRLKREQNGSPHKYYLLGAGDGIVIMASHLGIVLRPDLLEDANE